MTSYLSKEEVARLVKSGAMRYPDPNAPRAKYPLNKGDLVREAAAAAPPPTEVKTTPPADADSTPKLVHNYLVLERLVNDALEEVACNIEADRDHTMKQFPDGAPATPGLRAGYDRSITLVRAAKKG